MGQRLANNFGYKVAALFFAIFLWFYVNAEQNPPIERTVDVPIAYENLQEGWVPVDLMNTVRIRVRGTKEVLTNIREKEFSATVDLGKATLGENHVEIKVEGPREVEILSKSPNAVKVGVDREGEKNIPIEVATIGKTAEGYSAFSPSVKPGQIVLKGPQKLIDQVKLAKVEVDISNADKNMTLKVPVSLVNEKGNKVPLQSKEIIPQNVEVFIPIAEDTPSKTVPIKPVIIGKPANGYKIERVLTDPETIKIAGSYDKLDQVDQIETLPIYIANITEDLSQEIELKVPGGVSVLYESKAKVLVDIKESFIEDIVTVPVKVTNKLDNQRVTLKQKDVKIKVNGTSEEINRLEKELEAYVDVKDLGAGIYVLTVQLNYPKEADVLEIQPKEIEVQITIDEPVVDVLPEPEPDLKPEPEA